MKNLKSLSLILFLFVSFLGISQEIKKDAVTPFRKGRWLTGLSGSLSSNINQIRSSDERSVTNTFGIELATGKFIKDRLLIGGIFDTSRSNSTGVLNNTTETLFIGPSVNYYLMKSEVGSIFGEFSPGYVRFREEVEFTSLLNNTSINQESEGDGIGTIFGLGYSYVIHDRIAFDLGLRLNLFWLDLENESKIDNSITRVSTLTSNLSFSFGFNVLLDDFFF